MKNQFFQYWTCWMLLTGSLHTLGQDRSREDMLAGNAPASNSLARPIAVFSEPVIQIPKYIPYETNTAGPAGNPEGCLVSPPFFDPCPYEYFAPMARFKSNV